MKLKIKLFRRFAVLVGLLGISGGGVLAADTLQITGTVYSAVSRLPLQDVMVTSPELSVSVMTDQDGRFTLMLSNRLCPISFYTSGLSG